MWKTYVAGMDEGSGAVWRIGKRCSMAFKIDAKFALQPLDNLPAE
jgi:hypothetical protein